MSYHTIQYHIVPHQDQEKHKRLLYTGRRASGIGGVCVLFSAALKAYGHGQENRVAEWKHRACTEPSADNWPYVIQLPVKTIGSLNNSIVPAISSLYLGYTTPFVVKLHKRKSFFKENYCLIIKLLFSSPWKDDNVAVNYGWAYYKKKDY